ncbi:hypothetical protein BGZ50_006715 [Haplosporangium sp. Z 11]|nr:hypothetical protein BGZ50_006715 [Haplosporangium sp. Z 11]
MPHFSQHQNGQQARGMASNALQRFTGNFSVDSSNKVVYAITAINLAYAEAKAQRFRDGRLYYFMHRNFANSVQNLREGRTGRFDSAGHLGGGLFGATYYLTRLRPLIRKMGRR